ncbi:hypothetical protein E2542_SST28344 [Spatholobus suberectus]|nr:hypothetical protein E2542_SST28344 [Spatholobus suberectus]
MNYPVELPSWKSINEELENIFVDTLNTQIPYFDKPSTVFRQIPALCTLAIFCQPLRRASPHFSALIPTLCHLSFYNYSGEPPLTSLGPSTSSMCLPRPKSPLHGFGGFCSHIATINVTAFAYNFGIVESRSIEVDLTLLKLLQDALKLLLNSKEIV